MLYATAAALLCVWSVFQKLHNLIAFQIEAGRSFFPTKFRYKVVRKLLNIQFVLLQLLVFLFIFFFTFGFLLPFFLTGSFLVVILR